MFCASSFEQWLKVVQYLYIFVQTLNPQKEIHIYPRQICGEFVVSSLEKSYHEKARVHCITLVSHSATQRIFLFHSAYNFTFDSNSEWYKDSVYEGYITAMLLFILWIIFQARSAFAHNPHDCPYTHRNSQFDQLIMTIFTYYLMETLLHI